MDITMTNTPTDSFTCCFDTTSLLPRSLFEVSSKGNSNSDMHFPHIYYHIHHVADCLSTFNNIFNVVFLLPSEGNAHFQIFASPPRYCCRYAQYYHQEE